MSAVQLNAPLLYTPAMLINSMRCCHYCVGRRDRLNYSYHIITRISIQTDGLAFGGTGLCSYHVRSADGSYAKHLTVESYTVVMLLTFILIIIIISIPSPLTLSFQA